MKVLPVTLEGQHVRLEPLTLAHHDALSEVAKATTSGAVARRACASRPSACRMATHGEPLRSEELSMANTPGPMKVLPVTLEGQHVRLEPLTLAHLDALWEVAKDHDLWRWTAADVQTIEDLKRYVEKALREQAEGRALPFATVAKSAGRMVGSTRFGSIDTNDRRLEIGWTWVGKEWQRTAVNTEAKLLMLTHAFETLGCVRVELKTDALNQQSRAAIARLGAREEGTLRKHMITQRGRSRDTVYYSILDNEWPEVKARLEAALRGRHDHTPAG